MPGQKRFANKKRLVLLAVPILFCILMVSPIGRTIIIGSKDLPPSPGVKPYRSEKLPPEVTAPSKLHRLILFDLDASGMRICWGEDPARIADTLLAVLMDLYPQPSESDWLMVSYSGLNPNQARRDAFRSFIRPLGRPLSLAGSHEQRKRSIQDCLSLLTQHFPQDMEMGALTLAPSATFDTLTDVYARWNRSLRTGPELFDEVLVVILSDDHINTGPHLRDAEIKVYLQASGRRSSDAEWMIGRLATLDRNTVGTCPSDTGSGQRGGCQVKRNCPTGNGSFFASLTVFSPMNQDPQTFPKASPLRPFIDCSESRSSCSLFYRSVLTPPTVQDTPQLAWGKTWEYRIGRNAAWTGVPFGGSPMEKQIIYLSQEQFLGIEQSPAIAYRITGRFGIPAREDDQTTHMFRFRWINHQQFEVDDFIQHAGVSHDEAVRLAIKYRTPVNSLMDLLGLQSLDRFRLMVAIIFVALIGITLRVIIEGRWPFEPNFFPNRSIVVDLNALRKDFKRLDATISSSPSEGIELMPVELGRLSIRPKIRMAMYWKISSWIERPQITQNVQVKVSSNHQGRFTIKRVSHLPGGESPEWNTDTGIGEAATNVGEEIQTPLRSFNFNLNPEEANSDLAIFYHVSSLDLMSIKPEDNAIFTLSFRIEFEGYDLGCGPNEMEEIVNIQVIPETTETPEVTFTFNENLVQNKTINHLCGQENADLLGTLSVTLPCRTPFAKPLTELSLGAALDTVDSNSLTTFAGKGYFEIPGSEKENIRSLARGDRLNIKRLEAGHTLEIPFRVRFAVGAHGPGIPNPSERTDYHLSFWHLNDRLIPSRNLGEVVFTVDTDPRVPRLGIRVAYALESKRSEEIPLATHTGRHIYVTVPHQDPIPLGERPWQRRMNYICGLTFYNVSSSGKLTLQIEKDKIQLSSLGPGDPPFSIERGGSLLYAIAWCDEKNPSLSPASEDKTWRPLNELYGRIDGTRPLDTLGAARTIHFVLNTRMIGEIHQRETFLTLEIPFQCSDNRKTLNITFPLIRYMGEYILACDVGTSAIAALASDPHDPQGEDDTEAKLLPLGEEKYMKDGILNISPTQWSLHWPKQPEKDTKFVWSAFKLNTNLKPEWPLLFGYDVLSADPIPPIIPFPKFLLHYSGVNLPDPEQPKPNNSGPPVEEVLVGYMRSLKKYMKECLSSSSSHSGGRIDEAREFLDYGVLVFSVPNTFGTLEREAYSNILRKVFPTAKIDLISESDAIALQNLHRGQYNALVYDLGAGTLDLSFIHVDWPLDKQEDIAPIFRMGLPYAGNTIDHALARSVHQYLIENEERLREIGITYDPKICYARNPGNTESPTLLIQKMNYVWDAIRTWKHSISSMDSAPTFQIEPGTVIQIGPGGIDHKKAQETGITIGKDGKVCIHIPPGLLKKNLGLVINLLVDHSLDRLKIALRGDEHGKGSEFRVNQLIISGRASLFSNIRDRVKEKVRELSSEKVFEVKDYSSENPGESKAAVVRGALAYGSKLQRYKSKLGSFVGDLGLLYETSGGIKCYWPLLVKASLQEAPLLVEQKISLDPVQRGPWLIWDFSRYLFHIRNRDSGTICPILNKILPDLHYREIKPLRVYLSHPELLDGYCLFKMTTESHDQTRMNLTVEPEDNEKFPVIISVQLPTQVFDPLQNSWPIEPWFLREKEKWMDVIG